MALTDAQKSQIKKILGDYRKEVHAIVAKHKKDVILAVEDVDKKKTDKIRRLIGSA
ncbi:MAG: hypothetical protein WA001_00580 [Patescibacteria group bacterium]